MGVGLDSATLIGSRDRSNILRRRVSIASTVANKPSRRITVSELQTIVRERGATTIDGRQRISNASCIILLTLVIIWIWHALLLKASSSRLPLPLRSTKQKLPKTLTNSDTIILLQMKRK